MTGSTWNRRAQILIAAALSGAAVAVTVGLAYPIPVANPALGAGWQCHRSAGIVTTCRRISRIEPSVHRSTSGPVGALRV